MEEEEEDTVGTLDSAINKGDVAGDVPDNVDDVDDIDDADNVDDVEERTGDAEVRYVATSGISRYEAIRSSSFSASVNGTSCSSEAWSRK